MRRRRWLLGVLGVLSLAGSLWAAQIYPPRGKATAEPGAVGADADAIVRQLDELLTQQEALVSAVADIQTEVGIIKVRSAVAAGCD